MSNRAFLLANLGSPDSPSVKDVKRYLTEFLMDERVMDVPYLFRLLLVRGLIVPFRASKSASKYARIWTEHGSPLIHISRQLTDLVREETGRPTYLCMRYANPTPMSVLEKIQHENPLLEELVLLPLYPHYAMSSYETAVEHIQWAHQKGGYSFRLKVVPPFYKDEKYLTALSESIAPYLKPAYDHVLFSYHGVPERHLLKVDSHNHCLRSTDCCTTDSPAHAICYRKQVIDTTHDVATRLHIPAGKYSFSFQSRLGRDKWLSPYTAQTLKEMPARGIQKVVIVCPAFVSDCLETLEEIQEEGKEIFLAAGGKQFTVAPCLNTHPDWVKAISHLVHTV